MALPVVMTQVRAPGAGSVHGGHAVSLEAAGVPVDLSRRQPEAHEQSSSKEQGARSKGPDSYLGGRSSSEGELTIVGTRGGRKPHPYYATPPRRLAVAGVLRVAQDERIEGRPSPGCADSPAGRPGSPNGPVAAQATGIDGGAAQVGADRPAIPVGSSQEPGASSKAKRNAQRRRHRRSQASQCVDCGTGLSAPGYRRCQPCRGMAVRGPTRRIVARLYKDCPTAPLGPVARELGISPERVRQILVAEGLR